MTKLPFTRISKNTSGPPDNVCHLAKISFIGFYCLSNSCSAKCKLWKLYVHVSRIIYSDVLSSQKNYLLKCTLVLEKPKILLRWLLFSSYLWELIWCNFCTSLLSIVISVNDDALILFKSHVYYCIGVCNIQKYKIILESHKCVIFLEITVLVSPLAAPYVFQLKSILCAFFVVIWGQTNIFLVLRLPHKKHIK